MAIDSYRVAGVRFSGDHPARDRLHTRYIEHVAKHLKTGATKVDARTRRKRQTRREAGTQSQGSPRDGPAADLRKKRCMDKEVLLPFVMKLPRSRGLALLGTCLSFLVAAAPAAALPGGPGAGPAAGGSAAGGPAAPGGVIPPPGGFPAPPQAPSAGSCPVGQTAQLFSQFGDSASYSLVRGGTFEGPTGGWSLTGASVASGNEPFYVNSPSDSHSLNIQGGSEAISPSFCLSNVFPSWRFFLESQGNSPAAELDVWVQWTDAHGNSGQVPVTALLGQTYSSWAPSPVLTAGSVLPSGTTVNAQLVFSAMPGDAWNIDDVSVDPYAR
jgi:hypothetical protein